MYRYHRAIRTRRKFFQFARLQEQLGTVERLAFAPPEKLLLEPLDLRAQIRVLSHRSWTSVLGSEELKAECYENDTHECPAEEKLF